MIRIARTAPLSKVEAETEVNLPGEGGAAVGVEDEETEEEQQQKGRSSKKRKGFLLGLEEVAARWSSCFSVNDCSGASIFAALAAVSLPLLRFLSHFNLIIM